MGRQEDLDRAYAELERRKSPEALLAGKPAEPYTVAGPGGERVLVTWELIWPSWTGSSTLARSTPGRVTGRSLMPCSPSVNAPPRSQR